MSLKKKTVLALVWSYGERFSVQLTQLIVSMVLARLLSPEEFGLIGMLTVFMVLAQTFLDSGFGSALVQAKELPDKGASSVFYFNIFAGCLFAGLLFFAAPWIASFYHQPQLVALTRVMALILPIGALGAVHGTLLRRELHFHKILIVSIASSVIGGITGVAMALKGFGVWAIVGSNVVRAMVGALCVSVLSSWRPRWEFDFKVLRGLLGFGGNLLVVQLLTQLSQNLQSVLIGRYYSAADLGYFSRAKNMERQLFSSATNSVFGVLFPAFSRHAGDLESFGREARRCMRLMMFLFAPLLLGVAALAQPLIGLMYGAKWYPSVIYFQILCLAMVFIPINALNVALLNAQGRSDLTMKMQPFKTVLAIVTILIAVPFGVFVVVLQQLAIRLMVTPITMMFSKKVCGYSMGRQFLDLLPVLGAALLMAAGVWWLSGQFESLVVQLLVGSVTGVLLYALFIRLLAREALEVTLSFLESLEIGFVSPGVGVVRRLLFLNHEEV